MASGVVRNDTYASQNCALTGRSRRSLHTYNWSVVRTRPNGLGCTNSFAVQQMIAVLPPITEPDFGMVFWFWKAELTDVSNSIL